MFNTVFISNLNLNKAYDISILFISDGKNVSDACMQETQHTQQTPTRVAQYQHIETAWIYIDIKNH